MDYIKTHPNLPYELNGYVGKYMVEFYRWLANELRREPKYKNNLYIIEGIDITYIDPEYMSTVPLIIMGGSKLITFLHVLKRYGDEYHCNIIKSLFDYIRDHRSPKSNKEILRDGIKRILA